MYDPKLPTIAARHSSKMSSTLRFAVGLALSVVGYYLWQYTGVFVWFLTYCCGTSGDWATKPIAAVCVAFHIGLLSWLFRRQVFYRTWPEWAASVGVALGLYAYSELFL